jgi:SET domain-containing protein
MCKTQDWKNMKIVGNRPEGRGVLAKKDIKTGTIVCNYGGTVLTKEQANLVEDRDYLMEMQCTKFFFLYHSKESSNFSFGKYINHSALHPNLSPKIFQWDSRKDVIFVAKHDILSGQELCYNYGQCFKGVANCIASCGTCCK